MIEFNSYPKKQMLLVIMLILTIFYSSTYHRPILNSWEAQGKSYEHLKYRTEEWGLGTYWRDIDLQEFVGHDLDAVLQSDGGTLTRLKNGKHWHVTIIDSERHIAVVLDAYTGKLVTFILPLA